MADTQALANQAKAAAEKEDAESKARNKIFNKDPNWENPEGRPNDAYPTKRYTAQLKELIPGKEFKDMHSFDVKKIKGLFEKDPLLIKYLFEVFRIPARRDSANAGESLSAKDLFNYALTLIYDCIREDASFFNDFEASFKNGLDAAPLVSFVADEQVMDEYTVGKGAWLLTSLIANLPHRFSDADVSLTLKKVVTHQYLSKPQKLESLSNLLKCNSLRKQVWQEPGVSELIFSVRPEDPPQTVYRFVFNIWMLSFEEDIMDSVRSRGVVTILRKILVASRAEKVIRLSLVVLKNFLKKKELAIELVEAEVLDVVQQLEYEKWRDAELYEAIREVGGLIATEQSECSNFDTYKRELDKGKLSWGFIHTYKFWAENYKLFDAGDYIAVKKLAALLSSGDPETLAVACHDIGEFVSLHPAGKSEIAKLGVKEAVMRLMQQEGETYRPVRREALLCCQKIMLNKWQDAAAGKSA